MHRCTVEEAACPQGQIAVTSPRAKERLGDQTVPDCARSREDPPLTPPDALVSDVWPPDQERMRFCGFKPLSCCSWWRPWEAHTVGVSAMAALQTEAWGTETSAQPEGTQP